MLGPRRLEAAWLGWVHPITSPTRRCGPHEGQWVRGTVRETKLAMIRGRRPREDGPIEVWPARSPPVSLGMWDFPAPQIRGNRVHARGCDDVPAWRGCWDALDALFADAAAGERGGFAHAGEEIAASRGGSRPAGRDAPKGRADPWPSRPVRNCPGPAWARGRSSAGWRPGYVSRRR